MYKKANLLAGDAIINYKAVAALGHDTQVVNRFDEYLEEPTAKANRQSQLIGFCFGFSQFVQYAVWAVIYYAAAEFMVHYGTMGEEAFICQFAIMFGAFAAGQAQMFGPDMGKGKQAATKVFTYIDMPSRINAVDEEF